MTGDFLTWAGVVYAAGVAYIWLLLFREAAKGDAQSQHGGELLGCFVAFFWPLVLVFSLAAWLRHRQWLKRQGLE